MKTTRLLLAFLFLLSNFAFTQTLTDGDKEIIKNKQRVSYIYNFTKYIDWEELANQSNFVIGVLGPNETDLVQEFISVAAKKNIKNLPVIIKHFKSVDEITPTNILYLNKKYNYDLNPILQKLYFNHSLLVSEGYPFRMSMINFLEIDDEFHFEISQEKINRAKLLVDPALLSFSIQSTADWKLLYDRLQEEIETVQTQQVELEKLNVEISIQEIEIKNKQQKLESTLSEINIQNKRLEEQQKIVTAQKGEIQKQLNRLNQLSQRIDKKQMLNDSLVETFAQQQSDIDLQQRKLLDQANVLDLQKSEIQKQSVEIAKQSNLLKIKIGEIKQQRITLYVFITFLVFAFLFSFFFYRENRKRKESEKFLKEKNEELIALNKSLDSFTYRVSHDLKAPVINVKNMIEMLKEFTNTDVNPMLPEIFKNITLSTNRLESTIVDMLELTRIERVKEIKSNVYLPAIFKQLIPEYENDLQQINGNISTNLNSADTVFASDIELKSIFQNLITNSIKYKHPDRNLSISITSQEKGNRCIVTFKDNGLGIDLKKFEHKLFNMFQRFNVNSSITGTGVGMYIIKKLVETNNGTIALESQLNQGLTYKISFPLKEK